MLNISNVNNKHGRVYCSGSLYGLDDHYIVYNNRPTFNRLRCIRCISKSIGVNFKHNLHVTLLNMSLYLYTLLYGAKLVFKMYYNTLRIKGYRELKKKDVNVCNLEATLYFIYKR